MLIIKSTSNYYLKIVNQNKSCERENPKIELFTIKNSPEIIWKNLYTAHPQLLNKCCHDLGHTTAHTKHTLNEGIPFSHAINILQIRKIQWCCIFHLLEKLRRWPISLPHILLTWHSICPFLSHIHTPFDHKRNIKIQTINDNINGQ